MLYNIFIATIKNQLSDEKMSIKIINKKNIKEIDFKENTTVKDILKQEDIALETAVVKINDQTVTEDEVIQDNDEITIIKVIYGG